MSAANRAATFLFAVFAAVCLAGFTGLPDNVTGTPLGWVGFCVDHGAECRSGPPTQPHDVTLSQPLWSALVKVNKWVNDNVKPLSDMDHWGVEEKWSLPTDGYGDCEDYALMKRKMLMDRGWPGSTLLVAIVRTKKDEGHAVLMVETDRGEFVLDSLNKDVVTPEGTGYRFIKRQSRDNPNTWVSLIGVYK